MSLIIARRAAVHAARVSSARMTGARVGGTARLVGAALPAPAPVLQIFRRGMANRFLRKPVASSTALATRSSEVTAPPPAGVRIEGAEAQMAHVTLRPSVAFKVDPGAIVSVPPGVEVRLVHGAPQDIMQQQQFMQQQQQYQQQQQQQQASGVGGLLSRMRGSPTQQPQMQQQLPAPSAPPMLAELSLQPGQPPAEATLSPPTASRLHTVSMDDMGGEMYISRGHFLAAPSSVNVHTVDEPTNIPGLVLQRVDGVGSVVLKTAGQALPKHLADGEQMYVQPNRIVAVESTTRIMGGQGLLVTLVGPGNIVLQSLPSLEMALTQQAEQTAQVMQANGMQPPTPAAGFVPPFGFGSGMGLGGMLAQGMAFGVGSAIAHSAINSAFGGGYHGATPSDAPPPPPPAASDTDAGGSVGGSDASGGGDGGGGGWFGGMFGGDESSGDSGGWDDGGDGDDGGGGDW